MAAAVGVVAEVAEEVAAGAVAAVAAGPSASRAAGATLAKQIGFRLLRSQYRIGPYRIGPYRIGPLPRTLGNGPFRQSDKRRLAPASRG
jgi:hypothetical protein